MPRRQKFTAAIAFVMLALGAAPGPVGLAVAGGTVAIATLATASPVDAKSRAERQADRALRRAERAFRRADRAQYRADRAQLRAEYQRRKASNALDHAAMRRAGLPPK